MEGPGVHVIADELSIFIGQSIEEASGTIEDPVNALPGEEIDDVRAVKKRLFFDIGNWHVVIHFLMYGTYRVNETRERDPQLTLNCSSDTFRVYGSSVDILEAGSEEVAEYDQPTQDVLSDKYDRQRAITELGNRDTFIADILLDQGVFGGVGNRVKNEVLWELKIHPKTRSNTLSKPIRKSIVDETIQWMRAWLEKKHSGESMPHHVYRHETCSRCGDDIQREELGARSRVTYWCPSCQEAGSG